MSAPRPDREYAQYGRQAAKRKRSLTGVRDDDLAFASHLRGCAAALRCSVRSTLPSARNATDVIEATRRRCRVSMATVWAVMASDAAAYRLIIV